MCNVIQALMLQLQMQLLPVWGILHIQGIHTNTLYKGEELCE